MKDLRHLQNDKFFQDKLNEFTKKHFVKRNKYLLTNRNNPKFPNEYLLNVWSELKDLFRKMQNNRCAICENDLILKSDSSIDVEHYRYKNYYWWLAYAPNNYYLCCDDCNRIYKREKFPLYGGDNLRVDYESRKEMKKEIPLLLNVYLDDPLEYFELHFIVNPQTKRKIVIIKPKTGLDNLSLEKANTTIAIFNLDLHSQKTATDNSRGRLLEHFFNILIDVALKRGQLNKKDFFDFLRGKVEESKKHGSNLDTLDLLKLVLTGNFRINIP